MHTATSIVPISLRSQFFMFKNCWHLVNYIPHSKDAVAQSIFCYKHHEPTMTERWNNLAFRLISQLNIQPDCIVRALGSHEMISLGTCPADLLCQHLANHYGIKYNPALLTKKHCTRPLHNMPKRTRIETLSNKYLFKLGSGETKPEKILIIDDIVTTGTTMLTIKDAFGRVTPQAEFYFFVLARTLNKW